MHVDVNWFASLMEINEHIVQFLWQLGHQDDILSKNSIREAFSMDDEDSAFPIDSLYDSILETRCEKSRRYVVTLSCSPLQLDFITVPMKFQMVAPLYRSPA